MELPNKDLIIECLQRLLKLHPEGMSEYEILKLLKESKLEFFSDTAPNGISSEDKRMGFDALNLFQKHFFLFHCLYLLRSKLERDQQDTLAIHTLKIQILPIKHLNHKFSDALSNTDPLAHYYCDLSHLFETSRDDVDDMLTGAVQRIKNCGKRESSLTILGLQDPVDNKQIKEAYRKQVMLHHPDRGGSVDKIQNINGAIKILLG